MIFLLKVLVLRVSHLNQSQVALSQIVHKANQAVHKANQAVQKANQAVQKANQAVQKAKVQVQNQVVVQKVIQRVLVRLR